MNSPPAPQMLNSLQLSGALSRGRNLDVKCKHWTTRTFSFIYLVIHQLDPIARDMVKISTHVPRTFSPKISSPKLELISSREVKFSSLKSKQGGIEAWRHCSLTAVNMTVTSFWHQQEERTKSCVNPLSHSSYSLSTVPCLWSSNWSGVGQVSTTCVLYYLNKACGVEETILFTETSVKNHLE